MMEERVAQLEKESGVLDERTKNIAKNVESISDSVKQMQKWIMGFIISCALVVTGSMLKDHMSGTTVTAKEVQVKGVESNGR